MSQKSSLPQAAKSVSQVRPPLAPYSGCSEAGADRLVNASGPLLLCPVGARGPVFSYFHRFCGQPPSLWLRRF